jgi:hypothetical protein
LAGACAGDAAGNGIDSFATALGRGGNFGEFDGGSNFGLARVAADRQGAQKQQRDQGKSERGFFRWS